MPKTCHNPLKMTLGTVDQWPPCGFNRLENPAPSGQGEEGRFVQPEPPVRPVVEQEERPGDDDDGGQEPVR